MLRTLVFLIACGWFCEQCIAQQAGPKAEDGFTPLIVGDSLAGWEGNTDWFRLVDGVIVAGSLDKPIPHNMFLCSEKSYGDFELRLEAKLVGAGDNAGVQVRTSKIKNSHEVSGYQADLGSAWNRLVWGGLYDESRRNRMLAEAPAKLLDKVVNNEDWNAMTIRCQGPRIQIWVNGTQTVDYTEDDPAIATSGIIAVQIHGGAPAVASYRNVRIQELSGE